MGKRAVAVLCSVSTVAAVLAAPSLAGAQLSVDASVTEISSFEDNGYAYDVKYSTDLETAAYMSYDFERDEVLGLFVADISTNTARRLETPRSVAGAQNLTGISGDGSVALVSADWEGIEAGDADGGLFDAFLVDTTTGAVESLTGSLTDVSVNAVSIDDAGDTVLLAVFTSFEDSSLYLWDEGVLSELTLPGDPNSASQFGGPLMLSPDGTALLYSSQLGFQTRWHLHDLASGTESVIASPPTSAPMMSSDGSVLVSATWTGDNASRIYVWDTATTVLRSLAVAGAAHDIRLDRAGTTLITSGQSYSYDEQTGVEMYSLSLLRIDVATGAQTTLASSNRPGELSVRAIDADADRIIVSASSSMFRTGPISINEIWGGYDGNTNLFLLDFNGTSTPIQLAGYVGSLDDQMARLYQAYFDRAPDAAGLEFWRDQRAGGRNLDSVSDEFVRSPEFVETYGALDDDAFVELVYRNVLDRAPDAGGKAFWLDQLASGRTRGSLMTLFSESPEFIDDTGTVASESPNTAAVRRLYAALFGREADVDGLATWSAEANRGVPLDDIAWHFIQTSEFQELYGGLEFDPYAMVAVVYANGMDVEMDNAGNALADSHYSAGRPIEEIVVEITNSARFVAATSTTPIGG